MSTPNDHDITPTELCADAFVVISSLQAMFWCGVVAVSLLGIPIGVFYFLLVVAVNGLAAASLIAAAFLIRHRKQGWKYVAMIATLLLAGTWDGFVGVVCVVDLFMEPF